MYKPIESISLFHFIILSIVCVCVYGLLVLCATLFFSMFTSVTHFHVENGIKTISCFSFYTVAIKSTTPRNDGSHFSYSLISSHDFCHCFPLTHSFDATHTHTCTHDHTYINRMSCKTYHCLHFHPANSK